MRIPLAHLLVKSPLPRIADQMRAVSACVDRVPELVQALVDGDQAAIERLARDASNLEGEADRVKNEVRGAMPVRLYLPVDRRDVLRLIAQVDAIADCAEDVGVLLTLRPLEVPDDCETLLVLFVERVMATVETATRLVETTDTLIKSGFGGRAADQVRALIDEVGRREHEADKLQDQCAKVIFKAEQELSPVAVFMWMKLLNKLGDIANHAENVGDQYRLFIAG
ncbi:MAG: TIGR00153 family protein [Deltaproteobacteria bacterium]|nr:TIGR00153 family protein [Deltaproteobacteria bacterium]